MDPPSWKDVTELAKVAPMIHPTAAQKSQLRYEWNAPFGPHDQIDSPGPHPFRIPLWSSLMTEGVFLDFITGVDGLGSKVRVASKIKGELDTSSIPAEVRHLIPQFNLDASFPPSHLSHGLDDSNVLFAESTKTHEQLKAAGVPNELELVPGVGHMFEWNREDEPAVRKVVDSIALFLCKYLEA
jgi:acetyl esterase/lipase